MTLQGRAAILCGAVTLGSLAVVAMWASTIEYALSREIWLLRATGYSALTALTLALAMSPLGALHNRLAGHRSRAPAVFRRSLGITAAWLALLHGGLSLATYLEDAWPVILYRPFFRSGAIAVAILTALMVTSFPPIVRSLRISHWKHLHRLAYVAALLALHHMALSAFAPRLNVLVLLGVLLVVGALRAIR